MASTLRRWRTPLVGGVAIWLLSFPLLTWHPSTSHPVYAQAAALARADAAEQRLVRQVELDHRAAAHAAAAAAAQAPAKTAARPPAGPAPPDPPPGARGAAAAQSRRGRCPGDAGRPVRAPRPSSGGGAGGRPC